MIRRIPTTDRAVLHVLYGHAYHALHGQRCESSYQGWRRVERRRGEEPSRLVDFGFPYGRPA